MSALNQFDTAGLAGSKTWIAALFWAWYEANLDDKITLKIFKFPIRVKVRQLRPVFEKLFGPAPLLPFTK